jgi:hypothetical protein
VRKVHALLWSKCKPAVDPSTLEEEERLAGPAVMRMHVLCNAVSLVMAMETGMTHAEHLEELDASRLALDALNGRGGSD